MLELSNIRKVYNTGDLVQNALQGVSISFRENEFVSILGPSGSGKTTLLNIIGGLDRYTEGELRIKGQSTTSFRDRDWDGYRNNSIGFVFQSYNLIPHQTVLANVELALTLSGVSKRERREQAKRVLEKVGILEHQNKRPNQLSGGQMQRVAIARALINNPEILLADEPTGALDSETSLQIMALLKEIARDKLVIMVTHNPELAEAYSTRIVRLKDGRVISDTDPYEAPPDYPNPEHKRRVSMSLLTALSLSFYNLRTKKGRTLLTAFAGSIGIIGIALILALSTGMDSYIDKVQKDTMASYPLTIEDSTIDLSSLQSLSSAMMTSRKEEDNPTPGVHTDYTKLEASEMMNSSVIENNLTAFRAYLENPDSKIHQYLGESGVVYSYDTKFSVYSYDADNTLVDTDTELEEEKTGFFMGTSAMRSMMGKESAVHFSELLPGVNGEGVSAAVKDNYDLIYGAWPKAYNELVLVLNRNNSISAGSLYQLGFLTKDQLETQKERLSDGQEAESLDFTYEEICGHTFYLVPACDRYQEENGTFTYLENAPMEDAIALHIVGIIRSNGEMNPNGIMTELAYPASLTAYLIDYSAQSPVITAQRENPDTNVLTGQPFEAPDDSTKVRQIKDYLSMLPEKEKTQLYSVIMMYGNQNQEEPIAYNATNMPMEPVDSQAAGMTPLDAYLAGNPDEEVLLRLYDEYLGADTYADNMKAFGAVEYDAPAAINLYADDFESKEAIADCIADYNDTAKEADRITYTDYIALLTSSLTTIIDGISYVLVAFVAVSLFVSCIMIGIITHISVMERTKEIGILRALGASKGNISNVFNAETFLVGCCAGLLGVGLSYLLLFPINAAIHSLSGIENLNAILPTTSALLLLLLSIAITMLGGLIPAKKAAKKDPVIALRTE